MRWPLDDVNKSIQILKESLARSKCFHSWEKTESWPIRTYFDYFGFKVSLFPCKCKKCGKRKVKKFY